MSDKKLARKLGKTVGSVQTRRWAKHIPTADPQRKRWRPEDDKLLGTRPDEQVALLLGTSVGAVQTRRQNFGIPAFGSRPRRG